MKKTMIIAAIAAFAGVIVTSCGSTKVNQRVSDEQRAKIDAGANQHRQNVNSEK
ncbi:hypothetical protein AGMMS49982_06850 [Bacteroidia bacterium]|nr:hypothetical protein AGMMS49982_06850 [Bacteroidia bacterium]